MSSFTRTLAIKVEDYVTLRRSLGYAFQKQAATLRALRAICELDLAELQAAEPPRGFGRD